MTGLYSGLGQPLYLANDTFPQEPVWAGMRNPTEVIPNNKYSTGFPVNAGEKTVVSVIYASAPTTNAFEVRLSLKADFSDEYVVDTVTATTDTTYQFSITSYLTGIIRLKNVGTASITEAYGQSLAATFG